MNHEALISELKLANREIFIKIAAEAIDSLIATNLLVFDDCVFEESGSVVVF